MFDPYDKKKVNIVKNLCNSNIDIRQSILSVIALLPNGCLGFFPLYPSLDPNTMTFRFGQGTTEWHFMYSTSYDPVTKNNSSFFCYIMRLDMLPPPVLKKHNLKEGDASYYNLALGVGINGVWESSPLIICRGTYTAISVTNFTFEALDIDNGSTSWSSTLNGEFNLSYTFKSKNSKTCSFDGVLQAMRPPFLAAPDGCAPCTGGAGTLYTSYTQLQVQGTVKIDSSIATQTNAVGWVDHQWINSQVNDLPLKLLSNFSTAPRGLGKYLWLNLHVNDNLQYMISIFPKSTAGKGQKFSGTDLYTNRYPHTNITEHNVPSTAEVIDSIKIGNTEYPIKYKITIESEIYTMDSTPFGVTTTVDGSGNDHWDGSGLLYDYANNLIGTCFFEANQLQDKNEYNNNKYLACGVNITADSSTLSSTKLPFTQLLPTYSFFLILIVALILTIWLVYRIVKQ